MNGCLGRKLAGQNTDHRGDCSGAQTGANVGEHLSHVCRFLVLVAIRWEYGAPRKSCFCSALFLPKKFCPVFAQLYFFQRSFDMKQNFFCGAGARELTDTAIEGR
jgi:hypothetical protein